MVNQSGAIYWYQCGDLSCDEEYIGETSRTFGERYKEHLKAPSAIHHHSSQTGHTTNQNNFQIIGREGHNLARNIKESIYIRVNNPTLNNNIGKFNLSHIWDRVLLNTKGLTLKKFLTITSFPYCTSCTKTLNPSLNYTSCAITWFFSTSCAITLS